MPRRTKSPSQIYQYSSLYNIAQPESLVQKSHPAIISHYHELISNNYDNERTRRNSDLFSSSQFFSAENFSSFLDLDSTGEPVREISDQELTRLGFPIPTRPPDRNVVTIRPPGGGGSGNDFPMVDSPFFQIISREFNGCFSKSIYFMNVFR